MGTKNILLIWLPLFAGSVFGTNVGVGYEVERCDKNMSAIRFAECVKASKEGRKVKQEPINININTVKGLKKADDKAAESAAPPVAAPAAPAAPVAPAAPAVADDPLLSAPVP